MPVQERAVPVGPTRTTTSTGTRRRTVSYVVTLSGESEIELEGWPQSCASDPGHILLAEGHDRSGPHFTSDWRMAIVSRCSSRWPTGRAAALTALSRTRLPTLVAAPASVSARGPCCPISTAGARQSNALFADLATESATTCDISRKTLTYSRAAPAR